MLEESTDGFQALLDKLNNIESRNRIYEYKIQSALARKKHAEQEKVELGKAIAQVDLAILQAERRNKALATDLLRHRQVRKRLDMSACTDQEEILFLERNFDETKIKTEKKRNTQQEEIASCICRLRHSLEQQGNNQAACAEDASACYSKLNRQEINQKIKELEDKIRNLMPTVSSLFDVFGFTPAYEAFRDFQSWPDEDFTRVVQQHETMASQLKSLSILPFSDTSVDYAKVISDSIDLFVNMVTEHEKDDISSERKAELKALMAKLYNALCFDGHETGCETEPSINKEPGLVGFDLILKGYRKMQGMVEQIDPDPCGHPLEPIHQEINNASESDYLNRESPNDSSRGTTDESVESRKPKSVSFGNIQVYEYIVAENGENQKK